MFLQLKDKVLVTLMAEVAAIINSKSLVLVAMAFNDQFILVQAALQTKKIISTLDPGGEFGVGLKLSIILLTE